MFAALQSLGSQHGNLPAAPLFTSTHCRTEAHDVGPSGQTLESNRINADNTMTRWQSSQGMSGIHAIAIHLGAT